MYCGVQRRGYGLRVLEEGGWGRGYEGRSICYRGWMREDW